MLSSLISGSLSYIYFHNNYRPMKSEKKSVITTIEGKRHLLMIVTAILDLSFRYTYFTLII